MKNFLIKYWRLWIILIFGLLAIITTIQSAPHYFDLPPGQPGCDEPIYWKLGDVNERFPLSKEEFLATTFRSQLNWEKALNKKLFIYDQNSDFELKTLYDERQEMTYESQSLDEKYEEYEKEKTPIEQQYKSLQSQYEDLINQYEILTKEFEKDLREYEYSIKKWNKKRGAPPDVYDELKDKKDQLEKDQEKLEKLNNEINALVEKINSLANQLNIQADSINQEIETFKEKYGEPKAFTQGLYTSPLDNITIFQFQAKDDLELVLMHEFGHALGIESHVENPKAIMHYLMNQQDINNPQITQNDINAYNSICTPRKLSNKDQLLSYLIHTPWKEMKLENFVNILKVKF
ncbi:MAG: matrixin family metalloprotease [Patescibacteria group bacterium]|jgi:uncharacterized protein YlxW (UPF0749 family)|nr:matrixin family metalloprotease [Patescibacteria group bacterium]